MSVEYRIVRFPPLDRHSVVAFRLPHPANAHEAMFTVTLSRAAWESQGTPEELSLSLSAPIPGASS